MLCGIKQKCRGKLSTCQFLLPKSADSQPNTMLQPPPHLQLLLLHRHQLCVDVWQLLLAVCRLPALLAHAQGAEEVFIIPWHLLQAYAGQVVHRTAAVTAQNITLQQTEGDIMVLVSR